MTHLVAVLAALVCALPTASAAAVAPRPAESQSPTKAEKRVANRDKASKVAAENADFVITVASEVKLNGRPCQFTDVPNHAVITEIEVDADTKEVYKVHFSTKK